MVSARADAKIISHKHVTIDLKLNNGARANYKTQ